MWPREENGIERNDLTQNEKYMGFKAAFSTFNRYIESRNYIGAYVIAFSILEDRVSALFITRKNIENENSKKCVPFSKKLGYLLDHDDIDNRCYDNWLNCSGERNMKLHTAMWNLDEFQQNDCEKVIEHARTADKLRRI